MTPLAVPPMHGLCMVAWWGIHRPLERKAQRAAIAHDAMDLREKLLLGVSFAGLGLILFLP